MASSVFLLLALQLLLTMNGAAAIPTEELDAMLPVLSSSGYSRIANAIATSDLSLDFLSTETLTLFAPSDASLFALDMALEAASYISVLRSHVTPRRLSVSDLRLLTSTSSLLPTLLPNHFLNVTVGERIVTTITVNGLALVFPGLYYSSHVAVHGLAGALTFVSDVVSPSDAELINSPANDGGSNLINSPPPPNPSVELPASFPSSQPLSAQIQTTQPPAAPPIQVQAALAPATTSIVITDPNWLWPEIGEGNGEPPQTAAQLPENGDGSDPPRRRLPVTRHWSRIQLPAPLRPGKVDGQLKRQERIMTQATGNLPETILPLKEMIATDHHLRRTLLEIYSSNPYGLWNDPLCVNGCECLHC